MLLLKCTNQKLSEADSSWDFTEMPRDCTAATWLQGRPALSNIINQVSVGRMGNIQILARGLTCSMERTLHTLMGA
jgi:hypothetical protein